MKLETKQIESLNMLGYFQDSCSSDFVCGILGCESRVRVSNTGKYLFITSATNTISIAPKPSFDSLVDHIVKFQDESTQYDYFERQKDTWNTEKSILCSTVYVFAKSSKKSTRDFSQNLVRVKSSNVWAYGYDAKIGQKVSDLYVQFKGKNGGPGDVYQYFDVPLTIWKKFISTPSKGHFFWKYIRNNFKYRKLTGDKRGRLPNAIN